MWYILGLLADTYIPLRDNNKGVIFRNRRLEVVEIVRNALGCNNAIVHDNRGKNSYSLELTNRKLRLQLEERGLTPRKADRRFPENIDDIFVSHYIRGFVEEKSGGWRRDDIVRRIRLSKFNIEYLKALNKLLEERCGVKRKKITRDEVVYNVDDSISIFDFIYREEGLYIPKIKDRFRLIKKEKLKKTEMKWIERKEKIMSLLREGIHPSEICKILGYKNIKSLNASFFYQTGQTLNGFRRSFGT